MPRGSLDISIHLSTPVGDSVMVDHVYSFCFITIGGYGARIDLLLLNMVDFDVIFGYGLAISIK